MTDWLIKGAIFQCHCEHRFDYFEQGAMLIKQGKIAYCGDYAALLAENSEIESHYPTRHYKHHLISPGFIDVHVHYPQYQIIGSYGKQLMQWLYDYTFVEEQKFADKSYADQIGKRFFDEIIRHGTTSVMSFCTSHSQSVEAFFEQASLRNMRVVGGKCMMDRQAPKGLCDEAESSYDESLRLLQKWHHKGRNQYAVTPRFAITSSFKQLELAGRLYQEFQQQGVLLQTHINENQAEIKQVQQLYPKHKHYLDVYQKAGLLGSATVLGHCIHNQADELGLMAETGCKIALCPTSNLFLGSGLLDRQQFKHYHLRHALATDVGAGNTFSMLQVMNEAYKIGQLQGDSLSAVAAWYLSTLAGAEVLGIQHQVGCFKAGHEADVIVLNKHASPLLAHKLEQCRDVEQILFSLIMLNSGNLVEQVFIHGKAQLPEIDKTQPLQGN